MRGRPSLPRLWAAVKLLDEHYPAPYPVIVRLKPTIFDDDGEPLLGRSYFRGPRCFIELAKRQPFGSMLETLCHEWAHLVVAAYPRADQRRDLREHDPLTGWGNLYAAIYSDFFDDPVRFVV